MHNKKWFLLTVSIFVLLSFPLFSSVGLSSEMWTQTYGGQSGDQAHSLIPTNDGGYAIAGSTTSFGAGGYDFWLVKTDANGTMEWNQTYGGTKNDWANTVIQNADGGYALAGATESFGNNYPQFWLVKTDANGNMQWNKTYGGELEDVVHSLVETSDGGYALAGYTRNFYPAIYDFFLVKTDYHGNAEWNRTFGLAPGTEERIYSLVEAPDGGLVLSGNYGWLVKTDGNGNVQWNRTYGLTRYDIVRSLVGTSDGGYALAGVSEGYFWLVKTEGDGNREWNQTYGGPEYDCAYSVVETSDGGYALAGWTKSFGAGIYDFWLVKTYEHKDNPEFSSWIILIIPLFLVATLSAIIIVKKRLLHPR